MADKIDLFSPEGAAKAINALQDIKESSEHSKPTKPKRKLYCFGLFCRHCKNHFSKDEYTPMQWECPGCGSRAISTVSIEAIPYEVEGIYER